MNPALFWKSVLEQDLCPVVLCDLDHTIVYMNPAAGKRYAGQGGMALLGKTLMGCHGPRSQEMIEKVVAWFRESREHKRSMIIDRVLTGKYTAIPCFVRASIRS